MTEPNGEHAKPPRRRGRGLRQPSGPKRLPTVHEYSAGGLVIDGLEGDTQVALLIGHADRHGHVMWTMPKGHIEVGERAEQTAVREIAEETGIRGDVLAALGSIDFRFRAEGHVVHKTVHHYLLRFLAGEPCANDHEVAAVAWVRLDELPSKLAHADERRLAKVAANLIETLRTRGPAALPALPHSQPWRRPQTHSVARHRSHGQATPPATSGHMPEPGAPA